MAKIIPTIKKGAVEDAVRLMGGFTITGLGGGLGGEIGSILGGYLGTRYVVKGDFEKKLNMGIALLNTIDIFLERFTPRGVVG